MITTRASTVGTAVADYGELAAVYANSEADPASVIICPLLNPLPIPAEDDFHRHLAAGGQIIFSYEDGAFGLCMFLSAGRIRTCWGGVNLQRITRCVFDPGGVIEWCVGEHGTYRVDVGALPGGNGWAIRKWFEDYMEPVGMFDTTSTGHPGLDGKLLSEFDAFNVVLIHDGVGYRYEVTE